MQNIEKMESDGTFEKITKKERLQLTRERDKLRKVLEGVETLNKMPGALFIVDIKKEAIAVREAMRLNIPIFAIVDTNCDPDKIDRIIPANDDASRTIEVITKVIADAAIEGQAKAKELKAHETAEKERVKKEKDDTEEPKEVKSKPVKRAKKQDKVKAEAKSEKVKVVKEDTETKADVKTEKVVEEKTESKAEAKKEEKAEAKKENSEEIKETEKK